MEEDDDFDFLLQLAAADELPDSRPDSSIPALLVKDNDTPPVDGKYACQQAHTSALESSTQCHPLTGIQPLNHGNLRGSMKPVSSAVPLGGLLKRPISDNIGTQHVACYKEETSGLRVND